MLKHSGVYALGALLQRITSIIFLPIYTRYLTPADYGVIALIDLAFSLMAILIGSGIVTAVGRFHFDTEDEDQRSRIWMTGFLMLLVASTVAIIPCFIYREAIANLVLGEEITDGALYFAIVLPTLWFVLVGQVPSGNLVREKRSVTFLILSLLQLALNSVLNIVFLIPMGMGVTGVLLGNFIANALFDVIRTILLLRRRGGCGIDPELMRPLLAFGLPLMITAILTLIIHQADRIFLRTFTNMHEAGIYSLAYAIAQGMNTLLLMPFLMIWRVKAFELADKDGTEAIYAAGFRWFLGLSMLIMFALALFARPIVHILTGPDFHSSADLIPLICLGYWFYSAATFFDLSMLLEKQTKATLPASVTAATINLASNAILVPMYGAMGAAISTLITFIALASVACLVGQRVRPIRFPVLAIVRILLLVLGAWIFWRCFLDSEANLLVSCAWATLIWSGTFAVCARTTIPMGAAWNMLKEMRQSA